MNPKHGHPHVLLNHLPLAGLALAEVSLLIMGVPPRGAPGLTPSSQFPSAPQRATDKL